MLLPFHLARKKVRFLDERGIEQAPDQPNAMKFERFIFDLLPWAKNAIVVEGRTEEVFAPVKNAEGAATDTPTATRLRNDALCSPAGCSPPVPPSSRELPWKSARCGRWTKGRWPSESRYLVPLINRRS